MADLPGDPRCNFCGHLASAHRYETSPDLSVPCTGCKGGRCPPVPEVTTGELQALVRYTSGRPAQCRKPHRPADSPCSCGWVTWDSRPQADNEAVLSLFRKLWPERNGKHVPRVRVEGFPDPVRTDHLLGMILLAAGGGWRS